MAPHDGAYLLNLRRRKWADSHQRILKVKQSMTAVSAPDPKNLLAVHSLLLLIHHRNKNQHGRSKWWKWLSILNRTLWKLLQAVEAEQQQLSGPGSTQASLLSVEKYKEYLAVHAIPRCYLAFSTVVADNQFAVLGVVLMSILAELAGVLQIKLDAPPTAPLRHAYPDAKKEVTTNPAPASAEDVGEVVHRGRDTPESVASGKIATSDSRRTSEKPRDKIEGGSTASKKKSRKKRNTIDDLFSNIL